MDEAVILRELESLAIELDVEIRYEPLEGRGGLCRYKGKTCLIVNRLSSVPKRVLLLSKELARLPLEDVFIRPQIRELLENHRPESAVENP